LAATVTTRRITIRGVRPGPPWLRGSEGENVEARLFAVLEVVLLLAAVLGAVWGIVIVHEAGHFVAGLCLGVPARSMSIRIEQPPHVALRREDGWVAPDEPGYAAAFTRHNRSPVAAWGFVAGGFLLETMVVLALAAAFRDVGTFSIVILATSTALMAFYVIVDVVLSRRRGTAYGDLAVMWGLYRVLTAAVLVVVLLARMVTLLFVMKVL